MKKRMGRAPLLLLALVALGLAQSASNVYGHGNADAITAVELQRLLYFIASDALAGRATPSPGQDAAAAFVAENLAAWGVPPAAPNPAAGGPLEAYYLPIAMESVHFDPAKTSLSLNGASFTYGSDYVAAGAASAAFPPEVSGAMVFAGNGYVFLKDNLNPYQGLDVRGKIIVVAGAAPPPYAAAVTAAARGRGAPAGSPDIGRQRSDWFTPQDWAVKAGALAVVTCATAGGGGRGGGGRGAAAAAGPNGPNFTFTRFDQDAPASVPALTAQSTLAEAIFAGEPVAATAVLAAAAQPFALDVHKVLTLRLAITVEKGHTQDVLAMIPGTDPALKNEFVMLSAHIDHLGVGAPLPDGHTVFNGADDDGSGTTALLAMAHAFAQGPKPRRSILFVWHTGEEKGLWGSEYLARFPPFPLDRVIADLNMDMIGRSKPDGDTNSADEHLSRPGEVGVIGPRISSDELGQLADQVNAAYLKLNFDHYYDDINNTQQAFYRSDQYNYVRVGIPSIFFTTGLHADYHTQRDTPDKVDYRQQEKIARTIAAIAWQLANQSARPHLNATLPPVLVTAMDQARAAGWGQVPQ